MGDEVDRSRARYRALPCEPLVVETIGSMAHGQRSFRRVLWSMVGQTTHALGVALAAVGCEDGR
jgi:hypothetical protein